MYRRTTLRKMLPLERKEAKLINELDSVIIRLKNRLPDIHAAELEQRATIVREKFELEKKAYEMLESDTPPC